MQTNPAVEQDKKRIVVNTVIYRQHCQ